MTTPGEPTSPGKPEARLLLGLAASALVAVTLYRGFFAWLVDQWLNDRLYSHGFLVPLVSLYLVWIVRERLERATIRPAPWLGAAFLLPAAVALTAGRWGAFVQLESVSFLLFLPGVILLLWGVSVLRILIFPVLYLQFMVPWLDPILPRLQKPFQLVSAQLSVWLFKALGIPVLHRGVFIELPNISLEVARECSGVHFIISVMAVAIPLVYLTQRSWRRAAFVLAAGALITILSNGLRIAIDGCLGMHYGADMLHGPGHIFRGWFVAQVGWVGVFLVNWLVSRGGARTAPRLCDRWRLQGVQRQPGPHASPRALLWLGCGLLLCALALEIAGPAPLRLRVPLEELPRSMGRWSGRDASWPEAAAMFPGIDGSLSRVYEDDAGRQERLFIGYAARQEAGKSLVSYHADRLHDGARYVPTGLPGPWPSLLGEGRLRLDGGTYATAFWYQLPGQGSPKKLAAKLAIVKEALLAHRTGGMVVLAASRVVDPPGAAPAARISEDFLGQVRAHLPDVLPMAPSPSACRSRLKGEP